MARPGIHIQFAGVHFVTECGFCGEVASVLLQRGEIERADSLRCSCGGSAEPILSLAYALVTVS